MDKKSDPAKHPAFKRVIDHFLKSPPQPRTKPLIKSAQREVDAKDGGRTVKPSRRPTRKKPT